MISAGFICQSLVAGDVERQTLPEPNVGRMNKHDSSLMISLEAVLQGLSSEQKIVLVDVRGRKEFNRFRIPGSINIPLHFIKTKTFLRTKSLVLVNEGYCYACKEIVEGFCEPDADGYLCPECGEPYHNGEAPFCIASDGNGISPPKR